LHELGEGERLDKEVLRFEEQAHALLVGARLGADQHEPSAQLRPDGQRLLPQPQSPAPRHVEIGDDRVEALPTYGSEPFDPVRRGGDPTPATGQRAGDGLANGNVVLHYQDRQHPRPY